MSDKLSRINKIIYNPEININKDMLEMTNGLGQMLINSLLGAREGILENEVIMGGSPFGLFATGGVVGRYGEATTNVTPFIISNITLNNNVITFKLSNGVAITNNGNAIYINGKEEFEASGLAYSRIITLDDTSVALSDFADYITGKTLFLIYSNNQTPDSSLEDDNTILGYNPESGIAEVVSSGIPLDLETYSSTTSTLPVLSQSTYLLAFRTYDPTTNKYSYGVNNNQLTTDLPDFAIPILKINSCSTDGIIDYTLVDGHRKYAIPAFQFLDRGYRESISGVEISTENSRKDGFDSGTSTKDMITPSVEQGALLHQFLACKGRVPRSITNPMGLALDDLSDGSTDEKSLLSYMIHRKGVVYYPAPWNRQSGWQTKESTDSIPWALANLLGDTLCLSEWKGTDLTSGGKGFTWDILNDYSLTPGKGVTDFGNIIDVNSNIYFYKVFSDDTYTYYKTTDYIEIPVTPDANYEIEHPDASNTFYLAFIGIKYVKLDSVDDSRNSFSLYIKFVKPNDSGVHGAYLSTTTSEISGLEILNDVLQFPEDFWDNHKDNSTYDGTLLPLGVIMFDKNLIDSGTTSDGASAGEDEYAFIHVGDYRQPLVLKNATVPDLWYQFSGTPDNIPSEYYNDYHLEVDMGGADANLEMFVENPVYMVIHNMTVPTSSNEDDTEYMNKSKRLNVLDKFKCIGYEVGVWYSTGVYKGVGIDPINGGTTSPYADDLTNDIGCMKVHRYYFKNNSSSNETNEFKLPGDTFDLRFPLKPGLDYIYIVWRPIWKAFGMSGIDVFDIPNYRWSNRQYLSIQESLNLTNTFGYEFSQDETEITVNPGETILDTTDQVQLIDNQDYTFTFKLPGFKKYNYTGAEENELAEPYPIEYDIYAITVNTDITSVKNRTSSKTIKELRNKYRVATSRPGYCTVTLPESFRSSDNIYFVISAKSQYGIITFNDGFNNSTAITISLYNYALPQTVQHFVSESIDDFNLGISFNIANPAGNINSSSYRELYNKRGLHWYKTHEDRILFSGRHVPILNMIRPSIIAEGDCENKFLKYTCILNSKVLINWEDEDTNNNDTYNTVEHKYVDSGDYEKMFVEYVYLWLGSDPLEDYFDLTGGGSYKKIPANIKDYRNSVMIDLGPYLCGNVTYSSWHRLKYRQSNWTITPASYFGRGVEHYAHHDFYREVSSDRLVMAVEDRTFIEMRYINTYDDDGTVSSGTLGTNLTDCLKNTVVEFQLSGLSFVGIPNMYKERYGATEINGWTLEEQTGV